MSINAARPPNFALLVALAWCFVVVQLLLQSWDDTARTLRDTDDAMRLVQMRAWLAGQGWFDLHQARLQPPAGYDSHWSRLIDVGLAGLFLSLHSIADQALAERLMRAIWPLLWLLPTITGMVAIAWRLAGRQAALVALLLAMLGIPAYQQFTPGRIDHHNVQIALTMLTVAATVWSDRLRWAASAAGALSGLALAIGFESLPYIAVCAAAFTLRYVVDARAGDALRHYGLALAASAGVAFFVSVAPQNWTRPLCDAIAINIAAAVITGGLGLAAAARFVFARNLHRGVVVGAAAIFALAVFAAIEPRCLAGPFATVDQALWLIWLGDVREMQSLARVFRFTPLIGAAIAAFPIMALVSALVLTREPNLRRDFVFLTSVAAFALAAVAAIAAIRSFSYATWLGMPLVAAFSLRLFATLKLTSVPARVTAGLLLTPMVLSSGAITIAAAIGFDDDDSFGRPETEHCRETASYAALARLPAGLVVADVSFGPFLLALTPHSVLAAPYHRLSAGILTAHRGLAEPPERARDVLRQAGADYVMICGPRPPDGLAEPARSRSLWAQLQAGRVPDWLQHLPQNPGEAFRVYRITR